VHDANDDRGVDGAARRTPGGAARPAWRERLAGCVVAAIAVSTGLPSPPPWPATAGAAQDDPTESLARREADLQRQYLDLEGSFLRLADLLAASDPRRAAVLRDAFDRAREVEVGDRLGRIVGLLEAGQLLQAGTSQEDAIEQLNELLAAMEEGGLDRNLADTKREVRAFLGRLTKLIARQREVEGSTEAGAAADPLATRQRETAAETAELAGDLDRFARRVDDAARPDNAGEQPDRAHADGEPRRPADGSDGGSGKPEAGEQAGREDQPDEEEPITGDDDASRARRTRRLLQAAERRMREAGERLEEARRREAREEQQRALEELETARAELEEILRQVREEEVERLLVQLETRIRMMLRSERSILEATESLDRSAAMADRERAIEAARIGAEQEGVTAEAARAVTLVRDDGSAVAVLRALEQVHDDSEQAAGLFRRGDPGPTTLGLVADIVSGLEELLAAVERSRREEERQQQAGEGGGRPAEPREQPLVDQLAELKMLRSLQTRINARTARLAELLGDASGQASEPALVDALRGLARRQRAIEEAARDIVTGRTER
jgi:hypothetical protein